MARYKPYELRQAKMIPLSYADQVVPGSFEHALNEIVEEHLDMSVFEERYCNEETGARAYDPRVLLKIVLYGYCKGILSSRQLEEACRRNVVFMALSADTRPHFTTIAAFVRELEREVVELFGDVLLYCEELGLVGKEHFAVDGCKLSSNASKEWSGRHEDLRQRQRKLERMAGEIVRRHRERDKREEELGAVESEERRLERYRGKIGRIKEFLGSGKKKVGPSGQEQKTNVTDPDSAKMTTPHGVVQGYNGMAMVDDKHQVVVHAEAHGTGQEYDLLMPMVEGTRENFERIGTEGDVFEKAKLTADSGLHCVRSIEAIEGSGVEAYIADPQYRKREEAFAHQSRYKERHNREQRRASGAEERQRFGPQDFMYDEQRQSCRCPAGHKLYRSGQDTHTADGYRSTRFKAPKTACRGCELRRQCLRYPDRTVQRQVAFFRGRTPRSLLRAIDVMRSKFDSAVGRAIYRRRLGTVEPVFANLEGKGMRRFTLRGRRKVDTQWTLFTMVHNIEKIARYGALG
jgi:transposase